MTGAALTLRVRSVGSSAARALAVRGPAGRIFEATTTAALVAAFERACYLEHAGTLVAAVAPELLNGPLNLVVAPPSGVAFTDVPAGAAVALELHGATIWPAQLHPFDPPALPAALARLTVIERVLRDAPPESLAGRQPAKPLEELADALRRGDDALLRQAAGRLAGRGPGLTPSGDDALVGAMTALTMIRGGGAARLRRAIARSAVGRTTRLSAAYLKAASRGEAGEAWHRLRDALAEGSAGQVEEAARGVMAFGETSGADMLAGFVLAFPAAA
ncbi:MAG TPA: DUF2877 domain-containing protein [bacterium]|nr:DUF2877 domain-containing protein [bacterium]